jgi:predicted AAA+ superfamily ATPase
VVLSGSSPLLLRKGLTESLTGRFELLRSTHWTLRECQEAFGYGLEDYLRYGGYPGAASLRSETSRWSNYLNDAVIEPTLTRDVLMLDEVRKPAVLRALFYLGAAYSGQEVSYRKLLGQLDDAGNSATIATYLQLLANAGMLTGIQKYSEKILKTKISSPRLMVYDPALLTVATGEQGTTLLDDPEKRGRVVESAVGAYLLGRGQKEGFSVYWWRENNNEVDFVLQKGLKRTAIEVKSGRIKSRTGLTAFLEKYPGTYALIVGSSDISLEDFLLGKVALFQ